MNHFLLDTEMNTIEIIINKNKLKKPPLCSIIANFYRVCLPQDAIISPNEGSNFSLQFKIKITQFFLYQIVPNPLFSRQILNFEIYVTADEKSEYIEPSVKLSTGSRYFAYKIPEETEIAKLHIFTSNRQNFYTKYIATENDSLFSNVES